LSLSGDILIISREMVFIGCVLLRSQKLFGWHSTLF